MDLIRRRAAERTTLAVTDIVRRDALGTVLHGLAAHALVQLDADGSAGAIDEVGGPRGPVVPARRVHEIRGAAVAAWFVGQLPARPCDAVVIGSPHGAAVHLATALRAPWLPAAFETAVDFPDDDPDRPVTALESGTAVADALLEVDGSIAIRQLHDPVPHRSRPDGLQLTVRWQTLPAAYRRYLDCHLTPGGSVIVVRDVGRWPVIRRGDRYSYQLAGRANGLDPLDLYRQPDELSDCLRSVGARGTFDGELPAFTDGDSQHGVEPAFVDDLRWWASTTGRRMRQILYRRPEVLSATVADLYRLRLRHAGRTGNRLVVECGRLLSPWEVLRAGLVPYWCEHPLRSSVAEIEWWLAGSDQFSLVEVLPEPPGGSLSAMAELRQWGSVASFAGRRGVVDGRCARSYPLGAVPTSHAGSVLAEYPYDLPVPQPISPGVALAAISAAGETSGLLVL